MTTVVWFRNDLRLEDNPALTEAARLGDPILPLYIWFPSEEGRWAPGGASMSWLHHSLKSLSASLEKAGSRLVIRSGRAADVLRDLSKEFSIKTVLWNHRYEPSILQRDRALQKKLTEKGIHAESFNSSLLFEPWMVTTGAGKPYQVFTPFWRACTAMPPPPPPLAVVKRLISPKKWPRTESLKSLGLTPKIKWDREFYRVWQPGECGAQQALRNVLRILSSYPVKRDLPSTSGTSRLSPHLRFGEISPRKVWQSVKKESMTDRRPGAIEGAEIFLKEIGWREFAHHLLFHFPQTPQKPLHSSFEKFPWKQNAAELRAWRKGQTGYPIVDAGLRELWRTGWIHNRVRMIVASFLVKDLRLSWREGAAWFWDTLVDADLANNTLGWQWSAGCGAAAAPYFRIFNPVTQAEKFDAEGKYVRRWIPEISRLPNKWIHRPWEAPSEILKEAGVELGKNYPFPVVNHARARVEALRVFKQFRGDAIKHRSEGKSATRE